MKAMILAAGLGTRLRPWTLTHPKALVPIDGRPMLERVLTKLKAEGITDVVINAHHFSEQIIEFISNHDFGINIVISDESDRLLDTGGGIANASSSLKLLDGDSILIYNVDILSNANLKALIEEHNNNKNDITLLTSNRDSTRKLIFDKDKNLSGWHNMTTNQYRPDGADKLLLGESNDSFHEAAFSGIYVMNTKALNLLERRWKDMGNAPFPIMDFLLDFSTKLRVKEYNIPDLALLDIGKPTSLERAHDFISDTNL